MDVVNRRYSYWDDLDPVIGSAAIFKLLFPALRSIRL